MIKVVKSQGTKQIKANVAELEVEVVDTLYSTVPKIASTIPTLISFKSDNQGLIALAYNSVFYACTKHIEIQHHYICDEVASEKNDLQYVSTSKMIANRMTKVFTHDKFYLFVKQFHMN